jgi:general transcription factor 3C polypeptide 5 (transcription factor C subunit 1)
MNNNNKNNNRDMSAANANTEPAPWLPIPFRAVSAIEHPCIIKNIDKGITSLGGSVKLSKVRDKLQVHTLVANVHFRV